MRKRNGSAGDTVFLAPRESLFILLPKNTRKFHENSQVEWTSGEQKEDEEENAKLVE